MQQAVCVVAERFTWVKGEPGIGLRWKKWLKNLQRYMGGNAITDAQRKLDLLLYTGGPQLEEMFDALPDPATWPIAYREGGDQNNVFDRAVYKLNDYFKPSHNDYFDLDAFFKAVQEPGETLLQFVARLRKLQSTCGLETTTGLPSIIERLIISRVVSCCRETRVRRTLLSKTTAELTMTELIRVCRSYDDTHRMAGEVEERAAPSITFKQEPEDHVSHVDGRRRPTQGRDRSTPRGNAKTGGDGRQQKQAQRQGATTPRAKSCFTCGGAYPHSGPCPAADAICRSCSKKGHFQKVCKSKTDTPRVNAVTPQRNQPHSSASSSRFDRDDDEGDYICAIGQSRFPVVDTHVDGRQVRFKVDTCASITIIDTSTYQALGKPKLRAYRGRASPYQSESELDTLGEYIATITIGKCSKRCLIVVCAGNYGNLLGVGACKAFGVDPLEQIRERCYAVDTAAPKAASSSTDQVPSDQNALAFYKQRFPALFSDRVGLLRDHRIELHIDSAVRPVQARPRNVPYHLRDAVRRDIEQKLRDGIIEEVSNEPTGWLNELTYQPKKDGGVRICVDMRAANRAIACEKHAMPNVEEVLSRVNGMRFFAKIDLRSAFEQVELAPDSRRISRFRTADGIFQYRRLFFGINAAPERFNALVRKLLEGLPGQVNATDDILIMGRTREELHSRVLAVLARFEELGLTVSEKKCAFFKERVTFFGLQLSADGVSLSDEKTRALTEATRPTSKSELLSFLGLCVYASRWIANQAAIAEPLRELTRAGVRWHWAPRHEAAFETLRKSLVSAIGFYSTDWNTEVHVDASPVGTAAVLTQTDPSGREGPKVVQYVSRTLSDAERRYSQIEKEALAVVWACEKLQPYLLGHRFIIYTDNKAVELIMRNPLSTPPARILRWQLRLSGYDFEVVHKPGLGNIADFLSRHPRAALKGEFSDPGEHLVCAVVEEALQIALTRSRIQHATKADRAMRALAEMILAGRFTASAKDDALLPFKHVFDELSITEDGLIMRGDRLVLPQSLRTDATRLAHEGHLGLRKTLETLRARVWFPGMQEMVQKHYEQCSCQLESDTTRKTPLRMSEMPRAPWVEASLDFFGPFDSIYLLVLVDDYSRFPIVDIISATSAAVVSERLDRIFSIFGTPEVIRTDNGPPFNGAEFTVFSNRAGFIHRKVTPYYPQANGMVESFMKSLGKAVRTAKADGVPWRRRLHEFLRAYRAAPRFELSPYTVVKVDGNMIEASLGTRKVCRNASEFKRFIPPHTERPSEGTPHKQTSHRSMVDDDDDFDWLETTPAGDVHVALADPIEPVPVPAVAAVPAALPAIAHEVVTIAAAAPHPINEPHAFPMWALRQTAAPHSPLPRLLSFRLPDTPERLAAGIISSTILMGPEMGARLFSTPPRASSPPRNFAVGLAADRVMRLTVGRDNPGFYEETRKYVRHHTRMPIALPSPFPSGEEEIVSGGGGKVWDDKKDDSLSALFETLNVNEHEDEPPGPAPTAVGSGPPPSVKPEPAPHEDQSSMRSMMDCE